MPFAGSVYADAAVWSLSDSQSDPRPELGLDQACSLTAHFKEIMPELPPEQRMANALAAVRAARGQAINSQSPVPARRVSTAAALGVDDSPALKPLPAALPSRTMPAPKPIPTLLAYLTGVYKEALQKGSETATGPITEGMPVARSTAIKTAQAQFQKLKSFTGFIEFCENHLEEVNPPIQTWFPGQGVGLVLADGTRVVISRGAEAPVDGGMQQDTSMPITTGDGMGPTQINQMR